MEKLAYVVWRDPSTDPADLEQLLVERVAPDLAASAERVRLFVEDGAASARFRAGPPNDDGRLLAACVSFWLASLDLRAPLEELVAAAAAELGASMAGYLVTESVPLDYGARRDWPDGDRSPGISILTVFDKRADVSDEFFYGEWHGRHTPLSFDIHPLWLYIRNAVVRPVTPDARPLRGIVEEAVPTVDDLVDFDRFFGGNGDRERTKANIARVNEHMASFADVAGLQTCAAAEHIVSS